MVSYKALVSLLTYHLVVIIPHVLSHFFFTLTLPFLYSLKKKNHWLISLVLNSDFQGTETEVDAWKGVYSVIADLLEGCKDCCP